jgi:predicted O-methyltransferase YrrM
MVMSLQWRDVSLGDGPPISTSVTAAETAELQRLALGRRVIEVGSAYGYSTVALAQVAEHVTAIDPHQWLNSLHTLRANLDAYGVADRVDVMVEAFGNQFWPVLAYRGYGGVFIDGDHHEDAVSADIGLALMLIKPGGFLACHDYDEATCPGVARACDRLIPGGTLTDTLYVVTR